MKKYKSCRVDLGEYCGKHGVVHRRKQKLSPLLERNCFKCGGEIDNGTGSQTDYAGKKWCECK